MINSNLALEFMRSSVSGVSKTQILREFKKRYDLTPEDINKLIELCEFKSEPKRIKYKEFYNNPITKKAERIYFPFTQIYSYKDFLSKEECEQLIEKIDSNLRPSTVSDPSDTCKTTDYRTSSTSDLHYFEDSLYLEIDRKITDLMELPPFTGETMQGQKYLPGEFYKEHWDYFVPPGKEYRTYTEWMGQRTWTTMIYLNDVQEAGETYFKHLKLKIKPKRGLLLAWNNLYRNGIPNYKTMHEAIPPTTEEKYVITKWWRSWSLI